MEQLIIPSFVEQIVTNPNVRAVACEYLAGVVADEEYDVELTEIKDTTYLHVIGPGYPEEVSKLLTHPKIPIEGGWAYEDVSTGEIAHYLEVTN